GDLEMRCAAGPGDPLVDVLRHFDVPHDGRTGRGLAAEGTDSVFDRGLGGRRRNLPDPERDLPEGDDVADARDRVGHPGTVDERAVAGAEILYLDTAVGERHFG